MNAVALKIGATPTTNTIRVAATITASTVTVTTATFTLVATTSATSAATTTPVASSNSCTGQGYDGSGSQTISDMNTVD